MKRGYIILLAGTGTLIMGILIFIIFAERKAATDLLLEEDMVPVNRTIGPYQSLQISGHGTNLQ
jgi:hypothetical protein